MERHEEYSIKNSTKWAATPKDLSSDHSSMASSLRVPKKPDRANIQGIITRGGLAGNLE